MTLEQALTGAVVTLAGCVGALFAFFKAQFSQILAKLNECEEDREKLWGRIAELANLAGEKAAHFSLKPKDKHQ